MDISNQNENLIINDVTYYPNGTFGLQVSEISIMRETVSSGDGNNQHLFSECMAGKAILTNGRTLRIIGEPSSELSSLGFVLTPNSDEDIKQIALANFNNGKKEEDKLNEEEISLFFRDFYGFMHLGMAANNHDKNRAPFIADCELSVEVSCFEKLRSLVENNVLSAVYLGFRFKSHFGNDRFGSISPLYTDRPDKVLSRELPSKINYLASDPQDGLPWGGTFGIITYIGLETNKMKLVIG